MKNKKSIAILGPTATGKTQLAAHLSNELNGEVISADSRQVYRNMTIGTGKDLADFVVNGVAVPFHLIDIVDAGYEYSVFEYMHDFHKAYEEIRSRSVLPVICGGTGMYLEAILKGYNFIKVSIDLATKASIEALTDDELKLILEKNKKLHNTTDVIDRSRLIKAVEIVLSEQEGEHERGFAKIESTVFGIHFERKVIRERISLRLNERLKSGMIEEVEKLINTGLSIEKLKYYGLEYKFIASYLAKEISYSEMHASLEIAIHQFAKRQMTWFRRMEKNGISIHWIDGFLSMEAKVKEVRSVISLECPM